MICGDASPLYRRLYDSGLINSEFTMQYFSGRSFASTIIAGESHDPDAVMAEFLKEVELLQKNGIDKKTFETAKRATYGHLVAAYDNIDNIANNLASCRFLGLSPFDTIDAIADANYERAQERLNNHFVKERCALSVITPVKNN
jgi:predicted Zn-dependent peptidase